MINLNETYGDVEQRFRWTVMHVKGYKRGNLQDAITEACWLYINRYEDRVPEMPPRVTSSSSSTTNY